MSNYNCFWLGCIAGMIFVFSVSYFSGVVPIGKRALAVIEQCQKDLPRNQYCTIIAVVEEKTEED